MAPVTFTLNDKRTVNPFKSTDWSDQLETLRLPPILRFLRGDFACVPYGAPTPPPGLAENWLGCYRPEPEFSHVHGYCANNVWSLVKNEGRALTIGIDYPPDHPVGRVEKQILLSEEDLAVEVALSIWARRAVSIACGVHPIFEISQAAGDTRLELEFEFGRTFPVPFVSGISRFALDRTFSDLREVPLAAGGYMDVTQLPLPFDGEEVVQLCNTVGRCYLHRIDAGYSIELTWNAAHWPSCAVWLANAGRKSSPFDGRFRALGIEPVAAAFGLASSISANPEDPIAAAGVGTSVDLLPGTVWTTRYRFEVRQ